MRHPTTAVALVGAILGLFTAACTTESGHGQPNTENPPHSNTAVPNSDGLTTPARVVPYQPLRNFMNPASQWRLEVTRAPLATDSSQIVSRLADQVSARYGGVAAFNVSQYNTSFYQVPSDTRRQDLRFDDCQGKGTEPAELRAMATNEPFLGVPIPAGAIPAAGEDGELTIYSPQTDQLWEFWKANEQADGWHACWGGRIDDVSTSAGQFPGSTGVSASGLAIAPGSIRIAEIQAGTIDHALSLAVVDVAHYSQFSYPATRSDGNLPLGTKGAVQEGQRLRLAPDVDVASLGLSKVAAAVAVAAQRYGFIVTDRSGAVAVSAESSAGVVATGLPDPWAVVLAGQPSYQVLAGFPWDRLQALPVDWGKPE